MRLAWCKGEMLIGHGVTAKCIVVGASQRNASWSCCHFEMLIGRGVIVKYFLFVASQQNTS